MKQKDNKRISSGKRAMLIFICAFLSVVMIFGVTIGAITIVNNRRAAVKLGGVMMAEGVASYLAATYKREFMTSLGEAFDTEDFWSRPSQSSTKTNGELLTEGVEQYIKSIAVGAYLFDRYTSLTKDERTMLKNATAEVLEFKADGSVEKFNADAEEMGFDYDDFCRATELIYKAERSAELIYGSEGANLKGASLAAERDSFYKNQYTRVKILYIATRVDILRDDEGELEIDGDGNRVTDSFTAEQLLERRGDIERIRELIAGEGEAIISPEYFDSMQKKYNYSSLYNDSGYYFSPYSEYSARFAEASATGLPEDYAAAFEKQMSAVVETALNWTGSSDYREIEGDFGVCFVYRCNHEENAYMLPSLVDFFHDFYSDGAVYLYSEQVKVLSRAVELREKFYGINPITLPYNYMYVANFE